VVDLDRLHRLLGELLRRVGQLEQRRERGRAAVLADADALGNVKYLFVTAIEAAVDAAQHVVASEQLGAPTTNADAFRLLAAAGWLDDRTAAALAGACGFRNLLVHGYADVDDGRVLDALDRLDDLRTFAAAVAGGTNAD
jgi:uncharacterized protein YutE (UPF0331/DUF86 family)